MKVTCHQSDFSSALNVVNRATSGKSTLPVLNNVLLEAKGNQLHLSTTNLEIGINHTIDAKILEEGRVTIPVKLLSQYIGLLQATDITLSLQDTQTLIIETPQSSTQIKGIPPEEFPTLPEVESDYELSLPSSELLEAIQKTVFAAALDETRPVLAGVLFSLESNQLKVVATDSYRLAEYTLSHPQIDQGIKFIVPHRTIQELARILGKQSDQVVIRVSKTQVLFSVPNLSLVSRLIEGQFPPYHQIIPQQHTTTATLPSQEVIQTVKRASLFTHEGANNLKLTFHQNTQCVELTAQADQVGNEVSKIPGNVEGASLTIAFNTVYLLEALQAITTPEVTIELTTESSPGVLKPLNSTAYVHVVMPLKI